MQLCYHAIVWVVINSSLTVDFYIHYINGYEVVTQIWDNLLVTHVRYHIDLSLKNSEPRLVWFFTNI